MPSDPKVYFANERTFLAWTRTSGTVALAGLIIWRWSIYWNNVEEKYTGLALIAVGVIAMLYALVQFRRRAERLTKRDGGTYDDQYGPFLITVSFIAIVIARFVGGILGVDNPQITKAN